MPALSEFTNLELYQIKQLLFEHYQKDVELRITESDAPSVSIIPDGMSCAAVAWHEQDANFMIVKVTDQGGTGPGFYGQFFYTPHDQHNTGSPCHNDLDRCVVDVLHQHLNHTRIDHQT